MSSNFVANHYNNIDTNNVPVYVQTYPNDYYMSQNQNTSHIPHNQNTYSNNYYIPQSQNLYAPRDLSHVAPQEASNYLGNDSNGGEIAIGSNSPVELFTDNKHATTNIQLEDNNYEHQKSMFAIIFFTIGSFIAVACLYNYFHGRK